MSRRRDAEHLVIALVTAPAVTLARGSALAAMSTSSPAGTSIPRLLRQQSGVH
jgi:hypothetical protein